MRCQDRAYYLGVRACTRTVESASLSAFRNAAAVRSVVKRAEKQHVRSSEPTWRFKHNHYNYKTARRRRASGLFKQRRISLLFRHGPAPRISSTSSTTLSIQCNLDENPFYDLIKWLPCSLCMWAGLHVSKILILIMTQNMTVELNIRCVDCWQRKLRPEIGL